MMSAELQTTRGRLFFWLGLAVFPVFWAAWMRRPQFSRRQILGARMWTVVYVAAVIAAWFVFPLFQTRVMDLRWTYSHVLFQTGFYLWIWLLFRTLSIGEIVFGFIVSMDALAIPLSLLMPALSQMPPHPASLVFIVVPAIAHLLVEPVRRWRRRLIS